MENTPSPGNGDPKMVETLEMEHPAQRGRREAQLRSTRAQTPLPASDSHSPPPWYPTCQPTQLHHTTHLQRFDLLQ